MYRSVSRHIQGCYTFMLIKEGKYIRTEESGISIMNEIIEKYAKEYAKEYASKEKDEDIRAALEKGFSIESICEVMRVTRERVEEVQKDL